MIDLIPLAILDAALAEPDDGKVCVPRIPTTAMLEAGSFHTKHEELDEDDPRFYRAKGCAAAVWHDMVEAAMQGEQK